jgi:hypothetical protein
MLAQQNQLLFLTLMKVAMQMSLQQCLQYAQLLAIAMSQSSLKLMIQTTL